MGRTAFRGCVEVIIPHLGGRQAQVFIKLPYEFGQNLVLNAVNIEEALQYRFQVSYLGNLQVGGNPQTINVTVDTTNLAPGSHTATLKVHANNEDIQVNVSVNIPTGSAPAPRP